jgi:acid phosphatase type 7
MPQLRRLLAILATCAALTAGSAAEAAADPVIAAAGDIACDTENPDEGTGDFCRHKETSDLLVGAGLAAVLPLGDIQYRSSGACCSLFDKMMTIYDPTWGRVKSISRPVIGNHEGTWAAYFDYFNGKGASNGPAGPRGKGYYSFDVGNWHLIALNSECDKLAALGDGCAAGSEQERWLRADLAAHPTGCTLAYWHQPRYSSGHDGEFGSRVQPFWQALYDAHAEVVLVAHSHDYERFAPLSAGGDVNRERGIRQFVVGTGGAHFTGGLGTLIAHSEVSQNDDFGVLKLTLHQSSYDWRFEPIAGRSFTDSGTGSCHGPSPPVTPAPSPGPGPAVDRTAPVISRLSLTRTRFALPPRGRGTTFRYTLSEIAAVRFRIKRKVAGRYKTVGTFTDQGVAGKNRRRFRGRLNGKRLRPGYYRAGLVALDYVGNRSTPKRVRFRVVRP